MDPNDNIRSLYRKFAEKMRPIINLEMPNLKDVEMFREIAERWQLAPENPNKKHYW